LKRCPKKWCNLGPATHKSRRKCVIDSNNLICRDNNNNNSNNNNIENHLFMVLFVEISSGQSNEGANRAEEKERKCSLIKK